MKDTELLQALEVVRQVTVGGVLGRGDNALVQRGWEGRGW